MSGISFVDTNVLVYNRDASEPEKRIQAQAVLERLWREESGRISFQVLQEYYAVVTRKLSQPMPVDQARRDVANLITWKPAPNSQEMMQRAWRIQDRFGLSWWDGLIVAAAHLAKCRYLLTEDLQAGQDLDGLLVVNPFASPSGSRLAGNTDKPKR